MVSLSEFTLEDGKYLVSLARRTVETYLKAGIKITTPKNLPSKYYEKLGVFVTIECLKQVGIKAIKELRGCIGYPYPIKPLIEALIDSAISAAVEDPRFPPMKYHELDDVVFEVSILSKPEEIKVSSRKELPKHVVIGRDAEVEDIIGDDVRIEKGASVRSVEAINVVIERRAEVSEVKYVNKADISNEAEVERIIKIESLSRELPK